eukprot:3280433-Alexandrium_andersonii.AAC.1
MTTPSKTCLEDENSNIKDSIEKMRCECTMPPIHAPRPRRQGRERLRPPCRPHRAQDQYQEYRQA